MPVNASRPRPTPPREAPIIDPPPGFTKPQGEGKTFDLVDTWEETPDGKLRLVQLGDFKIQPKGGEEEQTPSYNQPAQSMAAMPMSMGQGAGESE